MITYLSKLLPVLQLGVVFSAYMVTAWGKPADVNMDGKGLTVTKVCNFSKEGQNLDDSQLLECMIV